MHTIYLYAYDCGNDKNLVFECCLVLKLSFFRRNANYVQSFFKPLNKLVWGNRNGVPRPTSLIIVEGIMLSAQFLFAMAWKGSLYFATIFLGLSYGSFSSINPAISSELFGLKSFGPIFGLLTLSAPASSTVLAGFVAGTIYDREAEKQQSSDCTGQVCFYLTCWIMVGVCAVGMVLSAALSWRVRGVYKRKAETITG